jgi:hypothetical protein
VPSIPSNFNYYLTFPEDDSDDVPVAENLEPVSAISVPEASLTKEGPERDEHEMNLDSDEDHVPVGRPGSDAMDGICLELGEYDSNDSGASESEDDEDESEDDSDEDDDGDGDEGEDEDEED